jgi:hypothetical protein
MKVQLIETFVFFVDLTVCASFVGNWQLWAAYKRRACLNRYDVCGTAQLSIAFTVN